MDWIDVTERAPMLGQMVLVGNANYTAVASLLSDDCKTASWFIDSKINEWRSQEVITHWMALPERPKAPEACKAIDEPVVELELPMVVD